MCSGHAIEPRTEDVERYLCGKIPIGSPCSTPFHFRVTLLRHQCNGAEAHTISPRKHRLPLQQFGEDAPHAPTVNGRGVTPRLHQQLRCSVPPANAEGSRNSPTNSQFQLSSSCQVSAAGQKNQGMHDKQGTRRPIGCSLCQNVFALVEMRVRKTRCAGAHIQHHTTLLEVQIMLLHAKQSPTCCAPVLRFDFPSTFSSVLTSRNSRPSTAFHEVCRKFENSSDLVAT